MLRRMRWIWLAAALLATLITTTPASVKPAAAATFFGASFGNRNVNVSFFYDALAPYGRWIDYAPYGYVWTPGDMSYGWRPYSDGDWVYTDYGWTWVDDEPWGWAAMHYGRWFWDEDIGWVWVPGTTWAPAWVAWASDDDWVGWAPLPPDMGWSPSLTVSFSSFDLRRVPSTSWCFVDRRDLTTSNLRSRILPVARNASILPRMQNTTRFASRGGRPVNMGPDVRRIERLNGRPVQRLQLADLSRPANGRPQIRGNELPMFRGRFRPAPANVAPKHVSAAPSARANGRMNPGATNQMNGRANGRGMPGMGHMRGDMANPSASAAQNQERQRFDVNQAVQGRTPPRRPAERNWQPQRGQANPAQMERNDQVRRAMEQRMQDRRVQPSQPPRPDRGPAVIRDSRDTGPRVTHERPANGRGRPDNGGNAGGQPDNGGGNGNGNGNGNGHGRGHGE